MVWSSVSFALWGAENRLQSAGQWTFPCFSHGVDGLQYGWAWEEQGWPGQFDGFPCWNGHFFGVYLSHFQIHRRMKWWMTWWMKWYRWYGWSQAPKFRLQDWQHDQLYKGGSIQKMDSEMGFSRNGPKLIQNLLKISKHHPRSVRNHRSFEFLSQFRAETPAFAPHFRVWGSSPSCCRRAWRDPCSFYTTWEMHQLRGMPWSTMACLKSLRTRLDPPQWY